MGVPLVLPHTSLTIPARSLHNLKNVFEIEKFTFILILVNDTPKDMPLV